MPEVQKLADQVIQKLHRRPQAYMVGIAGIPGSGKTTLCRELAVRLPHAAILPMDGYHLLRSQLNEEGMRRRGALFTFDGEAFQRDIANLRKNRHGSFPSFDHAEKDPRPDAIKVNRDNSLVIVEGIYVLMRSWRSESLFDLRVFLDIDLDQATERLARRHVETGLASTIEQGRERAISNDRVNSLEIFADGCRERADLILRC